MFARRTGEPLNVQTKPHGRRIESDAVRLEQLICCVEHLHRIIAPNLHHRTVDLQVYLPASIRLPRIFDEGARESPGLTIIANKGIFLGGVEHDCGRVLWKNVSNCFLLFLRGWLSPAASTGHKLITKEP